MEPILYFLRSSEQFIVDDILYYAARLDDENKTLENYPTLSVYRDHYGKRAGDIGVYAMIGSEVAGAAWVRIMNNPKGYGFINNETPELVLGIKPKYRNQGLGTQLMEHIFREVPHFYDQMSLSVRNDNPAVHLYKRLGFEKVVGSDVISNDRTVFTMKKVFNEEEKSRNHIDYAAEDQAYELKYPTKGP